MADLDVLPPARAWSSEDRNLIGRFAALPATGSAIFTVATFPTEPKLWPLAVLLTATGAYVTAFLCRTGRQLSTMGRSSSATIFSVALPQLLRMSGVRI